MVMSQWRRNGVTLFYTVIVLGVSSDAIGPDYQLNKRDRVNPDVSQDVKVVTKPTFDYPFRWFVSLQTDPTVI